MRKMSDFSETPNETDASDEIQEGINTESFFARFVNRLLEPLRDLVRADTPGRVDKLGKAALILPSIVSILIIVLILGFLWYEAMPIFLDPSGGPGIIVSPTWDPNRDLYGIGIFIVGSSLCTGIAIGLALPLGVGGAIFLSEFCHNHFESAYQNDCGDDGSDSFDSIRPLGVYHVSTFHQERDGPGASEQPTH